MGGEAEVAYFVKEKGAAIGRFNTAHASFDSSGDALFDAEQLALNQRFGQRRTVHSHERLVSTRAHVVHCAGGQFFPGPILTGNEDGE